MHARLLFKQKTQAILPFCCAKRTMSKVLFRLPHAPAGCRGFHPWRNPAPANSRKEPTMSNKTLKPIAKLSMHPVTAAIWRHEKDGKRWYSTTIERRYKDDAGTWRSTNSFNAGDLPLVAT